MDEVAAGGGFPIDHFAGEEDAGEFAEHEILIEFGPRDAAGGGDRLGEGAGPGEGEGVGFDEGGELFGGFDGAVGGLDEIAGGGREFPAELGFVEEVTASRLHFCEKFAKGEGGFEIDDEGRLLHGAKGGTEGVEWAAFETGAGDDEFADGVFATRVKEEVFEGSGFVFLDEPFGPVDVPTTVGGGEGVGGDSDSIQGFGPGTIGSGVRPGTTAESEDDGVGRRGDFSVRGVEGEGVRGAGSDGAESVVHVELHGLFLEALNPAAEKRGGFESFWINATISCGKGADIEAGGPGANLVVGKSSEGLFPEAWGLVGSVESLCEFVERFGVGEVESTFAGDEEFATDGAFGVEESDRRVAF